METNLTRYKKDLDILIHEGYLLLAGLYNELDEEYLLQYISKNDDREVVLQHKEATFTDKYQVWCSEAYTLKQHYCQRDWMILCHITKNLEVNRDLTYQWL